MRPSLIITDKARGLRKILFTILNIVLIAIALLFNEILSLTSANPLTYNSLQFVDV